MGAGVVIITYLVAINGNKSHGATLWRSEHEWNGALFVNCPSTAHVDPASIWPLYSKPITACFQRA